MFQVKVCFGNALDKRDNLEFFQGYCFHYNLQVYECKPHMSILRKNYSWFLVLIKLRIYYQNFSNTKCVFTRKLNYPHLYYVFRIIFVILNF